jgi:hypothetical protein
VISTTTLRQSVTPPSLLGRVSAINIMSYGARPLGSALGAIVGVPLRARRCAYLATQSSRTWPCDLGSSPAVALARQPDMVGETRAMLSPLMLRPQFILADTSAPLGAGATDWCAPILRRHIVRGLPEPMPRLRARARVEASSAVGKWSAQFETIARTAATYCSEVFILAGDGMDDNSSHFFSALRHYAVFLCADFSYMP